MSERTTRHRQWLKNGLFLMGLLFAASAVGYLCYMPGPEPSPPPLQVEASALDFGTAWAQPKFEWHIPIKNVSDRSVSVEAIRSSCKCSSEEPDAFVIAPDETVKVKVELDLMPNSARAASAQTRPFAVSLVPITKSDLGSMERVKWELHGTVSQALSLRPASVYFGENLVRGLSFPTKSVRVESQEPLESLEAYCEASSGHVSVTQIGRDDRRFHIDFRLNERMPKGPFEFTVFLEATTFRGEDLPRMPLTVNGQIASEFQASPAELHFGQRQLTEFATQVKVKSVLGTRFRLCDVEHGEEVTCVEFHPESFRSEHVVELFVSPEKPGHHYSTVEIATQTENGATETLSVPLRWYAVDPPTILDVPYDRITREVAIR